MKKEINMIEGPLLGNIIRYAVPIVLTGLLQLLFNAADLVVVGRFSQNKELAVAAVGATGSLTALIVNLFIGLSIGVGVTVAHSLGAGQSRQVRRTVHTAIPVAAISGLVLTVVGVVWAPGLLHLMATPEDVIGLSTTYMRLYFAGMVGSMLYNFGAAILRAAGDTRGPLVYLTVSGILNVVLNLVFVIMLDMSVAGVALATAISQALSAFLVVRALCRRTDACRLHLKYMHIYKDILFKILRIGLPAGIQSSLFSISNVLIQSSINSFGSVAMSGNAAAGNLEGFVYVAMNAFQQSTLNFTGQNKGALKYDRMKWVLWLNMACVTVVGGVLGLLLYTFGGPLLGIYIANSPAAIDYGMVRLLYLAVPYALCGMQEVATGAIRGMGYSFGPLVASVIGVCAFRIVWVATVFPQMKTLECLYISYPISWLLTLASALVMYYYYFNRSRRATWRLQRA